MLKGFCASLGFSAIALVSVTMVRADNAASPGSLLDYCGIGEEQSSLVESVDFVGFFPSRAAAERASSSIDRERFIVVVREAAVGGSWSLLATYHALPTMEQFALDKETMHSLGQEHGADSLSPACTTSAGRAET